MANYLSVFGLRTYEMLPSGPVTEQIYVHSKVMVVDDRWAIVGSANLNDRSLLGLRDSEFNVVIKDVEMEETRLGGPWKGGGFARGLRRALFAQHLGLSPEEMDEQFADPLNEATLAEIKRIAKSNTQIFNEVFSPLPSDAVRSWADVAALRSGTEGTTDCTRRPSAEEAAKLSSVKGHLVEYPIDFLIDEDLAPSGASALVADAFN